MAQTGNGCVRGLLDEGVLHRILSRIRQRFFARFGLGFDLFFSGDARWNLLHQLLYFARRHNRLPLSLRFTESEGADTEQFSVERKHRAAPHHVCAEIQWPRSLDDSGDLTWQHGRMIVEKVVELCQRYRVVGHFRLARVC